MIENSQSPESNSHHWRNLVRKVPRSVAQVLRNTPTFLFTLPRKTVSNIKTYFLELPSQPKLRFKTISISIAFLVISISILASSNPFKLLIPGSIFAYPYKESREVTIHYGLVKAGKKIVSVKKYFAPQESLIQQIRHLTSSLVSPVHFKDRKAGSQIKEVEPLPNFATAISQIWFQKESGLIIIDIREESLEDELNIYLANAPVSLARKTLFLDSYFLSLTSSILEIKTRGIHAVEYRIDGKRKNHPYMKFKLASRYK